ncbi:MAG: alginate export family protein [Sulfurovum sp.]|nr:alginate export family protein [Sulfurovum sp.]
MKKTLLLSVAASAMLMAGGDIAPVVETEAPAPAEFLIFNNIYAKGEIRPRYEGVDDKANLADKADAFTNRLTLGIGADFMQIDGLSVYLEGTNVMGSGDFFSTGIDDSNRGLYDTVADPDQTRITQAYLDYKLGDTLIRTGRQGVNLDNQRFIGTVDWRQMPQTYDAVAVINNSIENLDLLGAYVWRVNTVKEADFDTSSVLLHAAYHFMPELTVTGYGYLLEDIHDTYGIAATGKFDTGFGKVNYRVEYAKQSNPSIGDGINNNSDYYNLQAGLNMDGILLGAQYEVLGAGNGFNDKPFSTPLATLHAHNGWADVFLGGTPVNGLVDLNAMVGYKADWFGLAKVVYHDFSSDNGSTDYGTEWDVIYKNKIPGVKGLSGMIKAAWYDADADIPSGQSPKPYENDATKVWVMLDYKFSSK